MSYTIKCYIIYDGSGFLLPSSIYLMSLFCYNIYIGDVAEGQLFLILNSSY